MKRFSLIVSISYLALSAPALAKAVSADEPANVAQSDEQSANAKPKAFTTGVAKGRDMFDTAISASTLDDTDIQKISAVSVAEIIGNIPGIRSEGSGTDGFSAISIRGLPLAADGAKFLQLQEDGLPVLEFGDIHFASSDAFLRPDLSLSQIQTIRGGSASTFASNAPGGVVNFLSKTGEVEGGSIMASAGLDHDRYRMDFNYGGRIAADWRFNVGGFYREGEGPRAVGFNAFKGGQIKANLTREFAGGGYIRLYGKYLNDRQPTYAMFPIGVTGTNGSPNYANLPGLDVRRDSTMSQFNTSFPMLDQDNRVTTASGRNGIRAVSSAVGLEAQFEVDEWSVTERFRFSANSGEFNQVATMAIAPANVFRGTGNLTYANGPKTGQAVSADTLMILGLSINAKLNDLGTVTNDVRASRGWDVGSGTLTTSGGVYYSSQDIDMFWSFTTTVQDVAANGASSFVNIATPDGAITQNGVLAYTLQAPQNYHERFDVNYRVIAPYASLNYKLGKLAIGGSLRLDTGKVTGRLYGADLGGGRNGYAVVDMNGDGVIQPTERQVATLPLSQPGNVNYDYDYLSYSLSANYRFADSLSTFVRYSRGARAGADRLFFSPSHDPIGGGLTDPKTAFGYVKQAEAGVKIRSSDFSAYATGFWASTSDRNFQISTDANGASIVVPIDRSYTAKGVELEGAWHNGPFSLTLNGTYTRAKIDKDVLDATLNGNRPRHQANFFFAARPQLESGAVTIGTLVNGTTSSFAQDGNMLKQPGYVIVSPYVQYRIDARTRLSLNAFNVLDKIALISVSAPTVPASGITEAQALNGRTISASLRFDF
ncbi:TonB-dependent receptor [Sphingomonas aliaeris]|uniref:TonB-dependent receptor n=1 Tax=Sphingomonas aliaeris TaxID=2759526 RepID=A0A974S5K7_9SPHN|nr:TonB-dependent receptor [Sphingomonas aliaeris]QQV78669.1 TonB-dependent receptor [Sphingomonas aliaeris]